MRIRDEGNGFNPSEVADPLAPENRLKTSGRGIFYMKTFMDEVSFRPVDGGGMEIVLKKHLIREVQKEEKGP
jgi:serine/threonine-protein kinase RsbW